MKTRAKELSGLKTIQTRVGNRALRLVLFEPDSLVGTMMKYLIRKSITIIRKFKIIIRELAINIGRIFVN